MSRTKTYTRHAQLGWKDYRSGLPFPSTYDTWIEIDQRNYENGRQRAANYALATGRLLPPSHVQKGTYLATTACVGPAFFHKNDKNRSIPKMPHARQHTGAAR